MKATRAGDCAGCPLPISIGDDILWSYFRRWHARCARKHYAGRTAGTGAGARPGRLNNAGATGHRP